MTRANLYLIAIAALLALVLAKGAEWVMAVVK